MGNTKREVLIWRDFVHDRVESTRLSLWRLGFAPKYPRDKIFDALHRFYEEMGISAYVAYETLGDFDLLLRLWIPKLYLLEEVELRLRQTLEGCNLYGINFIGCRTDVHHAETPCDADLAVQAVLSLEDDQVRAINEYNAAQYGTVEAIDRVLYRGEPAQNLPEISRPPGVDELLRVGALMSIPLDKRGIRFFVIFDHPRQPFRPETRDLTLQKLRDKCREIEDTWTIRMLEPGDQPQISIYEGNGTMSDFIVMARAPHGCFHEFVHDVVMGLRAVDLDVLFEMRPYTHVIADRMFSDFQETRSVPDGFEHVDERTVNQEEGETLEFKATLTSNIRSYMAVGKVERNPDRVDDVVRAVCGLLNSPRAGLLVIGVLEVRREIDKRTEPLSYLQELTDKFGYAFDPADIPDVPNAVVGIELEIEGGLFKDRDQYVGFLRDTLRSRIEPVPLPWIRIEVVSVSGRSVCAIATRPADIWFYARTGQDGRESFFVREAASTRAYTGMESDLYKRAHPRGEPG
ncbi:MAG TPA: hypothetical protein VL979_05070 [Solirubrobacteraceae bacterium]|nr:hypothetical protein [Solirubrobacteraceae bacterium]